eukprot:snap_masked-scaffold_102-processed-gene-0.21-mRNA-1 protein AED:1.00 eAED:1.00 QI:0/0/0/0/1/1/2/0/77
MVLAMAIGDILFGVGGVFDRLLSSCCDCSGGGSVGGVGFQVSRSWASRYDISLGLLGCKLLLMFESLREVLDNLAHI